MKKLILALFLSIFTSNVMGDTQSSVIGGMPKFSTTKNENCSFKCPEIISESGGDYFSTIVDIDLENGILYCGIKDKGLPAYLLIKGSRTEITQQCDSDEYKTQSIETIKMSELAEIETKEFGSTQGTTFSQFLSSIVTLQNMSADAVSRATVIKEVPKEETTQTQSSEIEANPNKKITPEYVTIEIPSFAQLMDQQNIQYFNNLFNGMSTVYKHLQNLLFVVVGGFFLASIGGAKLQRYLENKGESTGQNQPYLHKFFIPLLCVGIFYMPISKSVNSNGEITATTTVIQELIRYFTREANNIADVASSIGAKTYIKKISQTIGKNYDPNPAGRLNNQKDNIEKYILGPNGRLNTILTICKNFYGDDFGPLVTMLQAEYIDSRTTENTSIFGDTNQYNEMKKTLEQTEQKFHKSDKDNLQAIELNVCVDAVNLESGYKQKIKDIQSFVSELGAKGQAQKDLAALTSSINQREKQFGWANIAFVPTSLALFEMQSVVVGLKNIKNSSLSSIVSSERHLRGYDTRTSDFNQNSNLLESGANAGSKLLLNRFSDEMGQEIAKVPFMMFPGAFGVYNWFSNFNAAARFGACYFRQNGLNMTMNNVKESAFDCSIEAAVPMYFGLNMVYYIYTQAVKYLPLICISVAATLALVGYLITLCKYFYISPFVVAFSLTTKRLDKIVNFLVTGITIFFKPVLIVMFLYLALFLHTLVNEVFLFSAQMQFADIKVNSLDFSSLMIKGIVTALLSFLGAIASCYVLWKTIMNGPDWTFKLIGLDKDADNVISQGISQKLEQRAVMV